jgi:hypothetical protein
VALADPSYAAIAPAATVQVAASVIVTAVLTPLLTSFMYKRVHRRRGDFDAAQADDLLHEAVEENRLHPTSGLRGEPT